MRERGHPNTAIIVFFRSARQEAIRKQLVFGNKNKAWQLAKILNKQALEIANKTGLPVIVGNENLQSGLNFGQRLQSTFQHAFQQGYERVIAIGNDCLSLSTSGLLHAQNQLSNNDLVLGPAYDGGVYLLGLSKHAFEEISFEKLPWQTEGLFEQLITNSKAHGFSVATMNWAIDADDSKSFLAAYQQLPFDAVLRNILFAFIKKTTLFLPFLFKIIKRTAASFRRRGPPIYSTSA